jgi:hypothetical protein
MPVLLTCKTRISAISPCPRINLHPSGGLGSLQLIDWPAQETEALLFRVIEQLDGTRKISESGAIDNQPAATSFQIHSSTRHEARIGNEHCESWFQQTDLRVPSKALGSDQGQ